MSLKTDDNEGLDGLSPSPRRSDRQGFTSEELKLRLYQTVKKKGIYDSLKSQLRKKLVFELNPSIEEIKSKAGETSLKRTSKSNLALNTINCLIIDHLKSNEFDYTLSVFMPECGININEVYSLEDILHILKVSPQSKIYEKLENSAVIKSKGLLWYLVNHLCQHYVTNDAAVQTEFDGMHSITSNLDDKLKRLDKHYDELNETLSSRLSFEEKLIAYQKQLEEKSKQDLAEKIKEFKENELAKIRIEERERQRREFATYRQELEAQLTKRAETLNAREATSEALLKERREREERELFQQRQKLLEEMKQLREKESDFKRSILAQTKLGESDTAKIERIEEELKRREERVRQAELDIEVRLKDEKEKLKIDLERTYSQRELILETTETKLKQEASQLSIERTRLDTLKHEYQAQLLRLSELDLELQKCRGECACLKQENALLKETVQKTLDYDFIKQENRDLRQKLDISKEIIGEKQLTARGISGGRLSERKRSVTFEHEGQNNQLGGKRHILPLNLAEENDEKTEAGIDPVLTYQEEGQRILDEAVERAQVTRRLEEQNMVNGELRDLYEMQLYEQRKLADTINDVKRQVEFLYYGVTTEDDLIKSAMKPSMLIDDKGLSDCSNFLTQAKDRLKFLETENERIENSFRNYQHKIKSKYYPINDDEEKEMRIVVDKKSAFNPADVEAFLESTLKATAKAKQMREDLEKEVERHIPKEKATDQLYQKVANLRIVDEMIKSVPLIQTKDDECASDNNLNSNSKFKELNFDYLKTNTNRSVEGIKTSKNDSDSSISSPAIKKFQAKKAPSLKESDDEIKSESIRDKTKTDTNVKSYLSMLNLDNSTGKPTLSDTNNKSEREEVTNTKRIKIEYSDSSSSSSSESVFEKPITSKKSSNVQSPIKKENNNDDDDDDFNW